jgi:hypothetical protein
MVIIVLATVAGLPCLSLPRMVLALYPMGTMVTSALNKFGCTSMPHANPFRTMLKPTPPAIVARAEEDLHRTTGAMEGKWRLLADFDAQMLHH